MRSSLERTALGRWTAQRAARLGLSAMTGLWLLVATPALGAGVCPGEAAPADEQPLSAEALRLLSRVGAALRAPVAIAEAASLSDPCVTRAGIFVPPGWLPTDGSPTYALGVGRLAWLIGLQRALLFLPPTVDVSRAAADLAGCALGRIGVRGEALTHQVASLRVAVGVAPADVSGFETSMTRGAARCASN